MLLVVLLAEDKQTHAHTITARHTKGNTLFPQICGKRVFPFICHYEFSSIKGTINTTIAVSLTFNHHSSVLINSSFNLLFSSIVYHRKVLNSYIVNKITNLTNISQFVGM